MAKRKSQKKPTRREIAVGLHEALIESAIQSVGRDGFRRSSVSRITEAAGVGQGTLYLYFGSYQLLLAQLLPVEAARMAEALGEPAVAPGGFFVEERRMFAAILRYLEVRPFILRLLIEAEAATPENFFHFMGAAGRRFGRILKRAQSTGELRRVPPREIQIISETLGHCRAHIALDVVARGDNDPAGLRRYEHHAVETYIKFLQRGIGAQTLPAIRPKRRAVHPSSGRRAIISRTTTTDARAAIFEAAGLEIAAVGIANTLIHGITIRARMSTKTFYSYFAGREEFLSALLLYVRRQVTRHIAQTVVGAESFAELEVRSAMALFDFMTHKPWLMRLAAEAAVWKPVEYRHHFAVISRSYRRQMLAAKARGELTFYNEDEIVPLSIMLTAARRFLGIRFIGRAANVLPDWVLKSYINLVCFGLGADGGVQPGS